MTATIKEATKTFRMYCYPPTSEANPAFDGAGFIRSWAGCAGSTHRHYQTRELVLCWSTEGLKPVQRETLRGRLEAHPANVGAVLAAIDARDEQHNRKVAAVNAACAGRA